jgi:putative transposase
MTHRSIPFLPDQHDHFYNRGNNRQAVFFERENYLKELSLPKGWIKWTL